MFVNKLALGVVLMAVTALVAAGGVVFGQQLFKSGPAATGVSEGNARELEIKREKLIAAKAELEVLTAAKDEALNHCDGMVAANKRVRGTYAECEIRGAMLTYSRCVNEETAKRAAIELAELGLSPASTQLEIMKHKVAVAKAELEVTIAAKDEAWHRYYSMVKLQPRIPGTYSAEDVRMAKVVYEDYVREETEKRAVYEQAQRELEAFDGI